MEIARESTGLLENWIVVSGYGTNREYKVIGTFFPSGTKDDDTDVHDIITEPILSMDMRNHILETSNRKFTLGAARYSDLSGMLLFQKEG